MSQLELSTMKHRIRVSDDVRYLSAGQVRERFGGVSDMWLRRYMARHGFPQPVQFGGKTSARHWLLSDVEHWERERAANHTINFPSRSSSVLPSAPSDAEGAAKSRPGRNTGNELLRHPPQQERANDRPI